MKKRVLAKEEAVDKRSEVVEHREMNLAAKEEQIKEREAKADELNRQRSTGTGKNLRTYLRTGKRNIC